MNGWRVRFRGVWGGVGDPVMDGRPELPRPALVTGRWTERRPPRRAYGDGFTWPIGTTQPQVPSGAGQQMASRSSCSSCWRCSGSSNATGSTMRLSGPRVQSSRWQPYSQSRPSGDRARIRAPSRSRSMSICSCQPLARSSRIRPHQISPQGLSARKASPARTASKACWISAAQQRLRGNRAGDASHCHGTRAPTPLGRSGCRNSGNGRDGARESSEIRRFRLPSARLLSLGTLLLWAGQRDGER